jgi:hypothetical protein
MCNLSHSFVCIDILMLCVSGRYKAHLLRKTWDRLAKAQMFGHVGANEAAVIIDYGQKIEPTGQVESQSECLSKASISQFASRKISQYQDSASPNRWCG